jgi:hypothetical protein
MSLATTPLGLFAGAIEIDVPREAGRIVALLVECRRLAAAPSLQDRAERVSGWSAAEHLVHLALASRGIFGYVRELAGGAGEPSGGPSVAGWIVLLSGWIPRGRGQAPAGVEPPPGLAEGGVLAEIERASEALAALVPLHPSIAAARGRRTHAVLGRLSAGEWLRYAGIHARHHLAIAGDVLASLR